MEQNPLSQGLISGNFTGIGAVTREMVRARAVELALINGHTAGDVTKADWEQAKQELSGVADADPKQALLEAAPESLRWDPVPGSAGHQARESANEDEDEEGRSETQQLVDQGVDAAEHDQMLQAARAAEKKDRREP